MKRKLKCKSSKYVLPSNRTFDILKIGVGTHNWMYVRKKDFHVSCTWYKSLMNTLFGGKIRNFCKSELHHSKTGKFVASKIEIRIHTGHDLILVLLWSCFCLDRDQSTPQEVWHQIKLIGYFRACGIKIRTTIICVDI